MSQGYSADNISFTGHSLGGGLAALMGVFFNKNTSINDEIFNVSMLLTQEVA